MGGSIHVLETVVECLELCVDCTWFQQAASNVEALTSF